MLWVHTTNCSHDFSMNACIHAEHCFPVPLVHLWRDRIINHNVQGGLFFSNSSCPVSAEGFQGSLSAQGSARSSEWTHSRFRDGFHLKYWVSVGSFFRKAIPIFFCVSHISVTNIGITLSRRSEHTSNTCTSSLIDPEWNPQRRVRTINPLCLQGVNPSSCFWQHT